jgi:3D (Asp-Asp-Asp) domain-containing protein
MSSAFEAEVSLDSETTVEIATEITPKLKTEFLVVTEPPETTEPEKTEVETTTESEKKDKAEKPIPQKNVSVQTFNASDDVDADDLTKLSEFANTGLPMSELTPPDDLELDENGIPKDFKYAVNAKATAYNGDPATASGRKPMPGHIAVNPKEYPYGTELYITSADGKYVYGYCVAADTGGFVKMGNTDVDLYMDNVPMCYDWGNRDIVIYVL